ncbi:MAG TPA: DUF4440 domain-containing protein [Gammaproteobacteria bacterium]|nr:DUF4440 domain-containing protein [Gammaproteobacteria bacterium]
MNERIRFGSGRRLLTALLLLMLTGAQAAQQSAAHLAGPEFPGSTGSDVAAREILKLEADRVEAYRQGDIAALERLLSADFTLTSGYGEFRRREEVIRYFRDEYLPSDQHNDDIAVRLYGSTAVVTGRTITGFVMNDRRATNHSRFLRVWIKQDDGWRNVAFQGTFMLRRFSEEPQPARLVPTVSQRVSQAGVAARDAQAEIMSAERERLRALQRDDAKALDRLLALEYVFVDPLGKERSRAEILASIAATDGQAPTLREDEGVEVRLYGNAAVVTGRTITRVRDSERTTSTRFTRVWVKHGSDWGLVVYQATHEMARTPSAPDFPHHARAERPQSERIRRLPEAVRYRGAEALEEFWSEVSERGTPLIESISGDDKHLLVTFLWRGGDETRNIVIFSGVTIMWSFTRGDLIDHSMERIPGTDVWFRSYTLPHDARFSYYLSPNDSLLPSAELTERKDYETRAATWQHDRLNPRREVRPHADKDWVVSLVELPDAPPRPWLTYVTQEKGSIVEHTFASKVLGGERRMWIYLPPRYEGSLDLYPLLVNFDGSEFGTSKSAAVLDHLIGEGKITPVVAVWIEQQNRRAELECSEEWNRFVVSEVVPWVRTSYRVSSDPQRTVVGGGSLGGLAALYLGLRHPETFGNVLSLSAFVVAPSHGFIMREFAAAPKQPLRFYLDVGLFERDEDNLLFSNRHLRDVLQAKGYEVHYAEFAGGHDQTHTDIGWADGLQALLPKHAAASARNIDLQPVRSLTHDKRYEDAEPAPSPDGKHVIFSRVEVEGRGRRRLWIVATSGSTSRPLTLPDFDWDCTRPSWSRDGQWIAFRASRAVNGSEYGGIWIMPAAGGAPRQLTGRSLAEDDYYPQWFPDGRQLAVLRDVPGTESDVWVVALDGTARRLTTHPAFDGKSTISPDGKWIAFPSQRSGARDLWKMPVAEGESAARQFTFDGGRGPAWSPDGRWIAYGCPVLPRGNALCLKRVEGGSVIQVTDGSRNDFNPEWGPDGTWIAVAQGDDDAFGRIAVVDVGSITGPVTWKAGSGRIVFDSNRSGTNEIYVVEPDGSNVHQLTKVGKQEVANRVPDWSPERTQIVFQSNRDGNAELYVMDADGRNVRRLTHTAEEEGGPAWSPDGKRIAYDLATRDASENYVSSHIWVMNADGSGTQALTSGQNRHWYPAWSPDGQKLAFVSNRGGNFALWVMNVDGSGAQQLTHPPSGVDAGPAWSPDGTRIAFDSTRDGNWEIYVMDADGSNIQRLTHTADRSEARPTWSPDGRHIAFNAGKEGARDTYEICVVNADGSNQQCLTNNDSVDAHPDWR